MQASVKIPIVGRKIAEFAEDDTLDAAADVPEEFADQPEDEDKVVRHAR